MKLFLLGVLGVFILLFLFFLFGSDFQPGSASQVSTAQPISGPTPTVDPRVHYIFSDLNNAIEDMERSTKFTTLEHISGASYQVVNVAFQPRNDGSQIFQIDVRCECAGNAACCSTLHTFVITMEAMDKDPYQELIIERVPTPPVTDIEIRCFDHTTLTGGMTAPWLDVVTFLRSDPQGTGLDGFRLWSEVTPAP
jgi:hypothetical protein